MPDSSKIREYYNKCRPDESIDPRDPRWQDLRLLRGGQEDVISRITREIEFEDRFVKILFTGFRGTGKTSLLRACEMELEEADYHVIYTDVEGDYRLNVSEPIAANDILLSIAMAITDSGLGEAYLKQLWEDIKSFAGARVLPENVGITGGILEFKAALEKHPTLSQNLQNFARNRSLYEAITSLISSAQAKVRKAGKRGIALILDSLDHLTDPPMTTETPVTESFLRILRESSELTGLDIHLILTAPPTILPFSHELRAVYGEPRIVPEARILNRKLKRDGGAFIVMREFVGRRVPLDSFESEAVVDSLISASGGYLRDLVRLLRECLISIESFPITMETAKKAILKMINFAAELPIEDYKQDLIALLENPEHRMPRGGDKSKQMYSMIRDRAILRYNNGDQWEVVHPSVLYHIDRKKFDDLVFPEENTAPAM